MQHHSQGKPVAGKYAAGHSRCFLLSRKTRSPWAQHNMTRINNRCSLTRKVKVPHPSPHTTSVANKPPSSHPKTLAGLPPTTRSRIKAPPRTKYSPKLTFAGRNQIKSVLCNVTKIQMHDWTSMATACERYLLKSCHYVSNM